MLLGNPTIETTNVPMGASDAALIESTNLLPSNDPSNPGPMNAADADTVGDMDMVLSTSLPSNGFEGRDLPTVGEGIYQNFMLSAPAQISFEWSYATYDSSPLDSVGYVLNGVYTELESTPIDTQPNPSPYTLTTIDVPQGPNTLAFVAYDTHDQNYDTQLYVSNVELAPEPPSWLLLAAGLAGLACLRTAVRITRFARAV